MNTHAWLNKPVQNLQNDGHPVIEFIDVRKHFGSTVGLDGLSLRVHRGEIVGIIGRSGAGKSTLIRCLNGLEKPDSGEIFVENTRITGLDERALQPVRRKVGVIFQHFNLLASKSVEDNVALPLKIAGVSRQDRRKRASELLDLVGLSDKAQSYPAELSGGQKQRVGIARALAANPAFLLSDEATSALDPETTRSILDLLKDINRKLGVTIVLITHEMEVVRSIASRVVVLDRGKVLEDGLVSDVFSAPQTQTAKSLLANVRPELASEVLAHLTPDIAGSIPARAILQVDLAGANSSHTLFVELGQNFEGRFRVLEGAVENIQGITIARFFLSVTTQDANTVDSIIKFLKTRSAHVEILGYDTRPF